MKDFILLGVILTFLASIISVYYSRKNLKTTKFIETVTSFRVMQISKIREIAANIIANLSNLLDFFIYEFERKEEEQGTNEVTSENWDEKSRSLLGIRKEFKFDTNVSTNNIEKLVRELYFLRLWVDEDKYVNLSNSIKCFIAFFENQSNFILEEEIKNTKNNILTFIKEIHFFIKTENQMINKELDGKTNEKEIKWGILGYPLFYTYNFFKWLIIRN